MPYYRILGIVVAVVVLGRHGPGLVGPRRGQHASRLVTLAIMAVGLKLAHWGYYAPEWNYRHSQGPWGRAIGQWIPRKWPLYTFHDWPPDLAFFIGRPVRQLPSPRFLEYLPGPDCRLRPAPGSEFDQLARSCPAPLPGRPLPDQSAGSICPRPGLHTGRAESSPGPRAAPRPRP